MRVKIGVILSDRPIMMHVRRIVEEVYLNNGREAVVTSGREINDSHDFNGDTFGLIHKSHSKHYSGYAEDYRTRYFDKGTQEKVAEEIRARLNKLNLGDFYVGLEKTHLHVQYNSGDE